MADIDTLARRVATLERLRASAASEPSLGEFNGLWLNLPALRGLWLGGSADETGAAYDRSGQGRTLTYNGNPTLRLLETGVPFWEYDGTGDYHSRADEAGTDVLGTESYVTAARRGLTVGGWFWLDALGGGSNLQFIGKYITAGDQRGYHLGMTTGDKPTFVVSSAGTAATAVSVTATDTLTTGRWHFLVGRLDPSDEMKLWVNTVIAVNTTSIPAGVHASTGALELGRFNGTTVLDGRWAVAFLCAANFRDTLVEHLYQRSRAFFGV